MKLVTFQTADRIDRPGALLPEGDVADLSALFPSLQALIEAGAAGLDQARNALAAAPRISAKEYRLRAPLPVPAQMRDFLTFERHLTQSMATMAKMRAAAAGETDPEAALQRAQAAGALTIPPIWYEQPVYYKANRFAVSGPDDEIVWPAYSQIMDYECELACVIGKAGKDIKKERAHEHMFGFTIFNDFSARDAQSREMQGQLGPAKGKDFDGANALGPCIVTLDEIGDPQALAMIVRINGQERSRGTSADMHWTFADLIAYVSQSETLHPGEILGSGTVGDGCGLEHGQFLADGDLVELEIEKIGILRNRVRRS